MVAGRSPSEPGYARLLPDKAKTFAFAARFLPKEERDAVTVLYAFCRTVDDLVDEPQAGTGVDVIQKSIADWRRWLVSRSSAPLPEPSELAVALQSVVLDRYRVPVSLLTGLLDGVESDLQPVRIPDFASLRLYSLQVAGTVGLAMCHIFESRQPATLAAAAELGIAMQLTNVLRDVGGDLRRGRIYLPADEMTRFGYCESRLRELVMRSGPPDDDFRALMRFQIARARGYYNRGMAGVWTLPPQVRSSILIAGRLYGAILDAIEANDYDVLHRRAATSRFVKVRTALEAVLLARLRQDRPTEAYRAPRAISQLEVWLCREWL